MNVFYSIANLTSDLHSTNVFKRLIAKHKFNAKINDVFDYINNLKQYSYDDLLDFALLYDEVSKIADIKLIDLGVLNNIRSDYSFFSFTFGNIYNNEECTMSISKLGKNKDINIVVVKDKFIRYVSQIHEKCNYDDIIISSPRAEIDKTKLFDSYKIRMFTIVFNLLATMK